MFNWIKTMMIIMCALCAFMVVSIVYQSYSLKKMYEMSVNNNNKSL